MIHNKMDKRVKIETRTRTLAYFGGKYKYFGLNPIKIMVGLVVIE